MSKTKSLTQCNKSELSAYLIETLGYKPEEISGLNRPDLIAKIRDHDPATGLDDATVEEVDENKSTTSIEIVDSEPSDRTDPRWTEYVMSFFVENELIDGAPTCNGLRRVFEKLLGTIIESCSRVVETPTNDLQRATVEHKLVYVDHRTNFQITVQDCTDCFPGNTAEPFCFFPVGTASTTAESRCLRKALGLHIITSEEKAQPDTTIMSGSTSTNKENTASDTQINHIQLIAGRMNIDVERLLHSMDGFDPDVEISSLSFDQARNVMQQLNLYERGTDNGGQPIPSEILNN